MSFKAYTALVKKDVLMELRQKHAFFGVLLYVGATVFVVFMMSGQPESRIWNTLFWLTQLFVAVNTVAKSFLQEHADRFRYYYTITDPKVFLLAKMTYSILVMVVMNLVSFALFSIMLGLPVAQAGLFVLISLIGSFSLGAVFTFLSAIAARAQQNSSLMAILGFPIVTPMLMILSKLALKALEPVYISGWWSLALVLFAVDILVVALGVILFPFLWKE